MTLPNATLFPQSLLPLYIFEPRYRQMLADALNSNRMFAVAMQKPGSQREIPSPVAGLGLIRVSVRHKDNTSHLILQGVARVELKQAVSYKPYRVQRIHLMETPPCDNVVADALLAKVRELLRERVALGIPFPSPGGNEGVPPGEILKYLDSLADPEKATDSVAYSVLPPGMERQAILETVEVEGRLRQLIQFLLAEIQRKRKGDI